MLYFLYGVTRFLRLPNLIMYLCVLTFLYSIVPFDAANLMFRFILVTTIWMMIGCLAGSFQAEGHRRNMMHDLRDIYTGNPRHYWPLLVGMIAMYLVAFGLNLSPKSLYLLETFIFIFLVFAPWAYQQFGVAKPLLRYKPIPWFANIN